MAQVDRRVGSGNLVGDLVPTFKVRPAGEVSGPTLGVTWCPAEVLIRGRQCPEEVEEKVRGGCPGVSGSV